MNDGAGDTVAVLHDMTALEPRPAPLEMPRQVLERQARLSLGVLFGRLFLRNA